MCIKEREAALTSTQVVGAATPTVPKVGSAPRPTGGGGGTNPQVKELRLGSDFLGDILQSTVTQSKTLNPWADSQV